ncbi:hypothetical protein HKX48_005872 [Thoreauomyces humboldtii]|nr:hypothetical protein HKX48_005872 [Thoreauomyces humboldtii]
MSPDPPAAAPSQWGYHAPYMDASYAGQQRSSDEQHRLQTQQAEDERRQHQQWSQQQQQQQEQQQERQRRQYDVDPYYQHPSSTQRAYPSQQYSSHPGQQYYMQQNQHPAPQQQSQGRAGYGPGYLPGDPPRTAATPARKDQAAARTANLQWDPPHRFSPYREGAVAVSHPDNAWDAAALIRNSRENDAAGRSGPNARADGHIVLQPSPAPEHGLPPQQPSKSSSLSSAISVTLGNPPSPLMSASPSAPFTTTFLAHSPLSVTSSFSPYVGPSNELGDSSLDGLDDSMGLDLFAALDSLGSSQHDQTRRLSVPDAYKHGREVATIRDARSLSPAAISGPGIGHSPLLTSPYSEAFAGLPYPAPDLEGLFDDLELIGSSPRDDGGGSRGSIVTEPSTAADSQLIPNLVVSAPKDPANRPADAVAAATAPSRLSASVDLKKPSESKPSDSRRSKPSSTGMYSDLSDQDFDHDSDSDSDDPGISPPPTNSSSKLRPPLGLFSCACGKAFKKLSSLRSHAKLHGRERSFICDECHKGFLRKHDLTRHTTTHLPVGEKPYTCPCGVSFTRQDAMMRHIRAGRCEHPGVRRGRKSVVRGAVAHQQKGQQASSSQPPPQPPSSQPRQHEFSQYLPADCGGNDIKMVPYPMPNHPGDHENMMQQQHHLGYPLHPSPAGHQHPSSYPHSGY